MSKDLINIHRREIRNERHNNRAKRELRNMENDFKSRITIYTFMSNSDSPLDSIIVKFRLNKKLTPREFIDILEKNLEGKF